MSKGKRQRLSSDILLRGTKSGDHNHIETDSGSRNKVTPPGGDHTSDVKYFSRKDTVVEQLSPNMDLSQEEIELHAAYMTGKIQVDQKSQQATKSITGKGCQTSGGNEYNLRNATNNKSGRQEDVSSDSDSDLDAEHLVNGRKSRALTGVPKENVCKESEIGWLDREQHQCKRKGRRRIPLSSDSESETELPDITIKHKRMRNDKKTVVNQKFNLRKMVNLTKRRESKRLSTGTSKFSMENISSKYDIDKQGAYRY